MAHQPCANYTQVFANNEELPQSLETTAIATFYRQIEWEMEAIGDVGVVQIVATLKLMVTFFSNCNSTIAQIERPRLTKNGTVHHQMDHLFIYC